MATTIASEVSRTLEASITLPGISLAERPPTGFDVMKFFHMHEVKQHVGISSAWIRTEIDRRRFMKKPKAELFTLYHVEGDNPKVDVNSPDNSVDAVIGASRQLFADLRQKIESCLREGNEQTVILDKLAALEQAQSLQSFAQRYSDFISAAANHILLLVPFNPGLTEMLHRVLS
jgi:hypothetical protein